MITKVILLEQVGLVFCRNDRGYQAPSLGGKFKDVIDNILNTVKKEEVRWLIASGSSETEVPFDVWYARGQEASGWNPVIPRKELDTTVLHGRSMPLGEDMTPRQDLNE